MERKTFDDAVKILNEQTINLMKTCEFDRETAEKVIVSSVECMLKLKR